MGKLYFVDTTGITHCSVQKQQHHCVVHKERSAVTNICLECSPLGLTSSQALSIIVALSHKPPDLRLSARAPSWQEGVQIHKVSRHTYSTCTHIHAHTHTHIFYLLHHHTHVHSLSASLSHTQARNFTSPGICSFYRAAVCWHGQRYGRTVSPSSDWISDQYPVPCQPASSGRTDCFWKPVLVVSRLPSLTTEKKCDCYLLSCDRCHTIFLHVLFNNNNLLLVVYEIDLGLHAYIMYLLQIWNC